MAISDTISDACGSASGQFVHLVSAAGSWVTANGDATTAQAEADLLNPFGADDAGVRFIRLTNATRALFRARTDDAATAVSASPVIRVYGVWAPSNQDPKTYDPATDGTTGCRFLRLDNTDPAGAGLTLTFPGSPSSTTAFNDNTDWFSQVPSLDGTDLKGAHFLLVLVETALAGTSVGASTIEAMILN